MTDATPPEQPRTAAGQDALEAIDAISEATNFALDMKAWNRRILAIEGEAREAAMVDAFDEIQRIDRSERDRQAASALVDDMRRGADD